MTEEIKGEQISIFDLDTKPVIKGYPELRWTGKRPYKQTQYYPAQLKERYGNPESLAGGVIGIIKYFGVITYKLCHTFLKIIEVK